MLVIMQDLNCGVSGIDEFYMYIEGGEMSKSILHIPKEQSLRLKGIAILMMLFYHLFNRMSLVLQCDSFLYIGGVPFVHWLSRAANPVWLYLFLSGYGYSVKRKTVKEVLPSIFNIYLHWWVVLLFALPLGLLFNPSRFNLSEIWGNISAWNPTYNSELWFLFPFVLLILLQKSIFCLLDKIGNKLYLALVLLTYLFCFFVFSAYGEDSVKEYSRFLWMLLMVAYMFVPFSIGILSANIKFQISSFKYQVSNIFILLLLALIIVIKCSLPGGIWGIMYQIPFFLCFVTLCAIIKYSEVFGNVLERLGKHSLSMWFIHSFICYHIFCEQLYSLKYPLLIFIVLVCISYVIAVCVDKIVSLLSPYLICKRSL